MGSQNSTSQPVEKKAEAKTYNSPRLVEYGNVQQLTQAVGNMGMMDGGAMMQKKTSP